MRKVIYCATLNGKSTTLSVKDWIIRLEKEAIYAHYGRTKILDLLKQKEEGRRISNSQCLGIKELYNAFNVNPRKSKQEFTSKEVQMRYDVLQPVLRSCLAKMARV